MCLAIFPSCVIICHISLVTFLVLNLSQFDFSLFFGTIAFVPWMLFAFHQRVCLYILKLLYFLTLKVPFSVHFLLTFSFMPKRPANWCFVVSSTCSDGDKTKAVVRRSRRRDQHQGEVSFRYCDVKGLVSRTFCISTTFWKVDQAKAVKDGFSHFWEFTDGLETLIIVRKKW